MTSPDAMDHETGPAAHLPSATSSISDATVIKNGDMFLLTSPSGEIPADPQHGYGLFFRDCRYLDRYRLRLAGSVPQLLVAATPQSFLAIAQLTNDDLRLANGQLVPQQTLGITWTRVIDGSRHVLYDDITVENFGQVAIELPLTLEFGSRFEDVFVVRGWLAANPGKLYPPQWEHERLHLHYRGQDAMHRRLAVSFSQPLAQTLGTATTLKLQLAPRTSRSVRIALAIAESPDASAPAAIDLSDTGFAQARDALAQAADQWHSQQAQIESNNPLLQQTIKRALHDLYLLRSSLEGQQFFAAGLPWYATLFGRDSLLTAMQTLSLNPLPAEQTLRLLARYQGQQVNQWRDEQPGKILHELRIGEPARLGLTPFTPYYGTVDATPLFLIVLARHAAWTGRLDLFAELRETVERALLWMNQYAGLRDGFLTYQTASEQGLIHQGWKDSSDAIPLANGNLATPPIALVEAQGYAYLAKQLIADLFWRSAEPERADRLRQEAEALRDRFERDFWLEQEGYYALAIQSDGRPASVRSSNPGHALWAGIASEERAQRTAAMLLADDMFSGWGIRTLSSREQRYHPVSYHLGSVWPHDNALIAAGCRRYGLDAAATQIIEGILAAASHFKDQQLPELFAGFAREPFGVPVNYPVACRPQAWGAGCVPFLIETLLGLVPNAFERQLLVVRPLLPQGVEWLNLRGLRLGDTVVDLCFRREAGGVVVTTELVTGRLEVVQVA